MNDKIRRFSVGNFAESMAKICLSENSLTICTDEGKKFSGSFYIGNDMGISMKGILYSDCRYITFKSPYFEGSEVSVSYTFNPEGLSAGDTISDSIYAITECGEVRIPFTAEIMVPSVKLGEGEITNLTAFAELAEENPGKAMDIFRSDSFVPVFLYNDIHRRQMYETVIKSPQTAQAMEEFLIDANKKRRVLISVDRNNIKYDNCTRDIYDSIMISRNTWGYSEIKISCDNEFIIAGHKRMCTDQFDGDKAPLNFRIDTSKLSEGKNIGKIYLDTILQHVEITIECMTDTADDSLQDIGFYIRTKLYRGYMDYIQGEMNENEFALYIDEFIVDNREELPEEVTDILEQYKRLLCDKSPGTCSDIAGCYENMPMPGEDAPLKDVIVYCAACYMSSLAASCMDDTEKAYACSDKIMKFYENGYEEPLIFYFLISSHRKYRNKRTAFSDIVKFLKTGQASPLIYYEFCRIANAEPQIIHEWADEITVPLAWGARRQLLNKDAAMVFTYHAGRIKEYKPFVIRSLCSLYEQFGLPDTLQVICSMLIRSDIVSEQSLKWYRLGIEKQLRITKIYEYYMQSLGDNEETVLPHQVIMYFMYDNHLGEREKAILFASVIRGRESNPAAYKAYSLMIRSFAKKQLEEGKINRNLAVIYTDCMRSADIDETIAASLPEVMFKHEIVCSNPNMKEVCVVSDELAGETVTPLVNGRALIDICTENTTIYLIDDKGNRYLGNNYYTIHRFLRLEGYADKCFEIYPYNGKLLAYMFSMCEKDYRTDKNMIMIRRYAGQHLKLSGYYQKRNLSVLITYYYEHAEGEYLDEILLGLDLDIADRATRQKWLELYIVRGMREKALEALGKYGYKGVDIHKLSKLCDDEIEESGLGAENEILLDIAYTIFKEGLYSDNILRYLMKYYTGPANNMIKLWETVKVFGLDTTVIEEKILAQLVFTENIEEYGQKILLSYLEHGDNKTLVKAYVCLLSYRYLTDDCRIDDKVWEWLWENMASEHNTCRILAMLKRLSYSDRMSDKAKSFCDIKLNEMISKGIVMDFYKRFSGKISLSGGIDDNVIIQCNASPGAEIMVRYSFGDEEIVSKAAEVYYGIYVKELAIFSDEKVKYEFFDRKSQQGIVLKKGSAEYKRSNVSDVTRFSMLNTMIKYSKEKDIDKLYEQMERYIRLDEAAKKLFKTL